MENKTKKTHHEGKKTIKPPNVTQTNVNKNNSLSVLALVIGIIAIFLCYVPILGLVLGVIAIILGIVGLKKTSDKGMSIAGIVTGGISLLINILIICIIAIGIISFRGVMSEIQNQHDSSQNPGVTTEFKKGEIATFDNLEVKVNSVTRNYISNNQYSLNNGKELVVINVDIKNISNDPLDFTAENIRLNADGVTNSSILMSVEPILAEGQLSSGATTTGNIVFQVKKDAAKLKLQYEAQDHNITFDYNSKNTVYTLDI